jgi:hypothetical protein
MGTQRRELSSRTCAQRTTTHPPHSTVVTRTGLWLRPRHATPLYICLVSEAIRVLLPACVCAIVWEYKCVRSCVCGVRCVRVRVLTSLRRTITAGLEWGVPGWVAEPWTTTDAASGVEEIVLASTDECSAGEKVQRWTFDAHGLGFLCNDNGDCLNVPGCDVQAEIILCVRNTTLCCLMRNASVRVNAAWCLRAP